MFTRALRIGCIATFLLGPLVGHAEILRLANGDTLQGRLLSRANGQIRWESPILGTLALAEENATILPDQIATIPSPPPAPPPQAPAHPTPAASASPAPAAPPTALAPAPARWKSTLESGLAVQSGRSDRADINFRFETTLQRRRNAYRGFRGV